MGPVYIAGNSAPSIRGNICRATARASAPFQWCGLDSRELRHVATTMLPIFLFDFKRTITLFKHETMALCGRKLHQKLQQPCHNPHVPAMILAGIRAIIWDRFGLINCIQARCTHVHLAMSKRAACWRCSTPQNSSVSCAKFNGKWLSHAAHVIWRFKFRYFIVAHSSATVWLLRIRGPDMCQCSGCRRDVGDASQSLRLRVWLGGFPRCSRGSTDGPSHWLGKQGLALCQGQVKQQRSQ